MCCSGGGVRSATFNLGALQALQSKPEVFDRVTTVTAVAGGSFIAAAHALVTARSPRAAGPEAKGLDPPAYALQSPEEQHLRDHTRYMVETWQLAVRCLAVAIRGVVINALLVGSLLFISGLLGGRLLRLPRVGIITGLQTAHPSVDLHGWWLIPAAALVITVGLAWLQAVLAGRSAQDGPWLWHKLGGVLPGRRASTWSRLFLIITLGTAFLLVLAPYAIKGLYAVSLGDGEWSVITRFLGFANGTGCRNAVMHHAVCGVPVNHPDAAASNGQRASTWHVKFATFVTFAAAVVALARATLGRLAHVPGRPVQVGRHRLPVGVPGRYLPARAPRSLDWFRAASGHDDRGHAALDQRRRDTAAADPAVAAERLGEPGGPVRLRGADRRSDQDHD